MPELISVSRRLVLRFAAGNSFSLNQINHDADDQALLDLAQAVNSIQNADATRVTRVVTRKLA